MSSPDRQELIRNAVAFLQGQQALASPLNQRIQFLEAKGLTPAEIDQAMAQASASAPPTYQQPHPVNYAPVPYPLAPPARAWDWRDYFVTAVISGSMFYGAVMLTKKYVLPHLQPPTASAYEEDRDALTAQFDAAEALLKEIQSETAAVRAAVEEQKAKIDKTTHDVEAVVGEMRQAENRTRDEMREIREEINNVREMLPKMIERNREHHTQSLNELQQEVKSLKTLLVNRPVTAPPSPSPLPSVVRPTIPAWQLASSPVPNASPAATSTAASESSLAGISPPTYPTDPSISTSMANGKEKEVEADSGSLPSS